MAVLQARTNSSRLPGKVLLPINGIPLAILAAKRAANTGRDVIIATSMEPMDDALAELARHYGINCYRGDLDNTLERIVGALERYDDETLVFRLTADNVFPDGALLDEIEQEFIQNNLNYICCNGDKSGLPYGMSVELTRLCHLREAANSTLSRYDQEHVTPFIRRKFGETYFDRYKNLAKGHFRCTIDCLDDYIIVQKVFSGTHDATQASSFDLVQRLDTSPYQPKQPSPVKKLVLGTAQLGLDYGIANTTGKPNQATAEKLIKTAISSGAPYIDTARVYGISENVIGESLKSGWEGRTSIITKLSPLVDCPSNSTAAIVNAFVDASIYKSCSALRMQNLDVLMLHRASHMTDWSGAVWQRLLEHKAEGTLKALGVSVQSPEELERVLTVADVGFIQMPFNVLDGRWDHLIPSIITQKHHRDLVIHVRSTLLQGLLPSMVSENWYKANILTPKPIIAWLEEQCCKTGRATITDFCLAFVKSLDWVDGLVIGMESLDQLSENIKILCSPDLSQDEINTVLSSRPHLEEESLNPAYWKN
ncbi:aldo/keto reductase [Pseudomonas citronellolis]|uniref:aldo/keto reductase n=1 Tax=Pseudomonas citronellolis TaxID=53408 RepID=UPI00226EAF72|nr:aldo/keto reductase [Pseudomonas citronellolis]WAB95562.1 aldo/keto reductase [Pseudomonas citronellolis]